MRALEEEFAEDGMATPLPEVQRTASQLEKSSERGLQRHWQPNVAQAARLGATPQSAVAASALDQLYAEGELRAMAKVRCRCILILKTFQSLPNADCAVTCKSIHLSSSKIPIFQGVTYKKEPNCVAAKVPVATP